MKFFLSIALITPLFAQSPLFWKEKEEVYKQIVNERAIIVSATVQEDEDSASLKIISAGHIQSPLSFTWKKLLDFSSYSQITDHFKEISFNKKENDLFVKIGALGYYADLWIKLNPQTDKTGKKNVLDWYCYKGAFKGMNGKILVESYSSRFTEISMFSTYDGKKLPIPDILITFGLETIGKQMASKIRSYIEDAYKNDTSID